MNPDQQRAYIQGLERADVAEFARMLRQGSPDEETVLRSYIGDSRFRRMRDQAIRLSMHPSGGGNERDGRDGVVVIPGVMGSVLAAEQSGLTTPIWLHADALMNGGAAKLALREDGRTSVEPDMEVDATGIMKRYYGPLLLSLAANLDVHAFWYDWRKDLKLAGSQLQTKVMEWFEFRFDAAADARPDHVIHIVAHAAGGLVARAFIAHFPELWRQMGGRLVLLGCPNQGSMGALQALTGVNPVLRDIETMDAVNDLDALIQVVRSFPSFYQMLPKVGAGADLEASLIAMTDGGADSATLLRERLRRGRAFRAFIGEAMLADHAARTVCILGGDMPTVGDIRDVGDIGSPQGYRYTLDGDGNIPTRLARLNGDDGRPVRTLQKRPLHHAELTYDPDICMAIDQILSGEEADSRLIEDITDVPTADPPPEMPPDELARVLAATKRLTDRLTESVRALRSQTTRDDVFEHDVRRSEDILVRDIMGGGRDVVYRSVPAVDYDVGTIVVDLQRVGIADDRAIDALDPALPVDAIAVGHFAGVASHGSLAALDRAIGTPATRANARPQGKLQAFVERGVVRGQLGQPFLLPDPRQPERLIAVMGMGQPEALDANAVAVLARDLCWTLGQVDRKHLATAVMGMGRQMLGTDAVVQAWVRGIWYAIRGVEDSPDAPRLQKITFVEPDGPRFLELARALSRLPQAQSTPTPAAPHARSVGGDIQLKVDYLGPGPGRADWETVVIAAGAPAPTADPDPLLSSLAEDDTARSAPRATRFTMVHEPQEDVYRYSAITDKASVPEDTLAFNAGLVKDFNDKVAGAGSLADQLREGRNLRQYVLPEKLRDHLTSDSPVVMLVDADTARIHWEVVASTDSDFGGFADDLSGESQEADWLAEAFLGTRAGLTRQLRTSFARLPEPPRPPRQVLRALVIADPAADAHLPGAEEEGILIADLLESFNRVYRTLWQDDRPEQHIVVKRLFGPREATPSAVMSELINHGYDILHFAGHCAYVEHKPRESGWVFSDKRVLSATEINRIARMPPFVFSNACESGVTPERAGRRNASLAPSFAEAFFARGVANFVCTAWPVGDAAARTFAERVYRGLLGLVPDVESPPDGAGSADRAAGPAPQPARFREPEPMHEAMRAARLALLHSPEGGGPHSWGAYQHYGNPHFQMFDAEQLRSSRP